MESSHLPSCGRLPQPGWRAAFAIDLRSLALVRIGLGLLLIIDLCVRWPDLVAHYSDQGVLPRGLLDSYYASRTGLWSLHMAFGSAEVSAGLFAIAAAIAIAFTLGYRSRLTGFISLLLLCSLQARNPLVLSGGDALLRMLLFWMLFLPSGARFSIDALRRAKRCGGLSQPATPLFSIGGAALLLQLAFIYWFSAILKDSPSWRSEGDALFLALSIDQFTTPLGRSMLAWPPGLLRALTLATFWLEVLGPLVAFSTIWGGRLRMAAIVTFLGFHLIALNLTLKLGLFPWICAVGWLAFLPPSFWEQMLPRWLEKVRRLRPAGRDYRKGASSLGESRPTWLTSHPAMNFLAAAALVYVLCWNIRTTNFELHQRWFPRQLNVIAQTLRIEQYWSMFAPYPMHDDGWYVARGALADGSEIDLITGRNLSWDKPERVAAAYPNQRWRKYCMNLRRKRYRDFRGTYVRYLIRRHELHPAESAAPGLSPLIGVELIYMREDTLPEHFAESPARPVVIFESARPGVGIDTEMAASANATEPSPVAADSGSGSDDTAP